MKCFKCFILIVILFTAFGCFSWRKNLTRNGGSDAAISNAITDFTHTSNLFNKNNVFGVLTIDKGDVFLVSITSLIGKIYPDKTDTIGAVSDYIPTRYLIRDGRLFYWRDSTQVITRDIISVLSEYDNIDTLWQQEWTIPPYTRTDGPEGNVYYMCKNNLMKYKKTKLDRIDKTYKVPKVRCK